MACSIAALGLSTVGNSWECERVVLNHNQSFNRKMHIFSWLRNSITQVHPKCALADLACVYVKGSLVGGV